ncbi:MAG: hypothetical protein SGBAC_003436 [Bacillariaceae sp.]
MAALTTMDAPLNEIEDESCPFAIDEQYEKEQPTLENLFSSPTASAVSSQPLINEMKTSEAQSPMQHQQQHDSSTLSGSNSRIVEGSTTSTQMPTNASLTNTPTSADFTKLATDSSLLLSQHDTESMSSNSTNSTLSMNSSGSNASSGSSNLPLAESDVSQQSQQHRMQASSTIMASSLFTVPLNSDSTMSLQNSRHNVVGSRSSSQQLSNSTSRMRFSQLMQTADDTNLPAVPEDEAIESFEMFGNSQDLIAPGTSPQIPRYSPTQQSHEESNQWFFNLLSAARRSSQPRGRNNQITILDASTSGLNAPLLATPSAPLPFLGGMDRARSRVVTSLEDSDSFEVAMSFGNDQSRQQQCSVEDIMNIVSNPTNLQLWYDPIQTLVVTSRSNEEDRLDGSDGTDGSADRQYEGEWIEASTTALESPPCIVGPLYELESTVRESLGVGSYGKITIFVEKVHGKVTLTVGPFPGGIHVRHTISVSKDDRNGVKIVDRVKLETREEDASTFQNTLSLGGMLSSCLLPPLASYMEQLKNSMAKLLLLVESGQVSRSDGGSGFSVPPPCE